MTVSDIEAMEIVQGDHYHAWALMPTVYTLITTGREMTTLAYVSSKQPHRDRSTARRHAKQLADGDYGPGGYMALKCPGGDGCTYTHDPFKGTLNHLRGPRDDN